MLIVDGNELRLGRIEDLYMDIYRMADMVDHNVGVEFEIDGETRELFMRLKSDITYILDNTKEKED